MSSLLKRVLDLSCNKFVEACAGAGKTFALSKRYCAILDEFTKPDKNRDTDNRPGVQNILVITFTKKATAEMSADIYKDLNTLLNRDEIESMKDQGIDLGKNIINAPDEDITWLRATFSQNSISTIDSFCTRILRENADILGIDPEFSLTEAAEYKRRFYSCLEDFLKQKSRDLNNDLKTILEKVSLSRIYSLFDRVHSSYQFLDDRFSDLESMSEDDIYNEWCRLYTPDFDNEKVLNEFNRISCFADSHVTDPDDSGIKWLRSLKTKLAGLPDDDPSKKIYVLTELIPMLFTKNGGYMSRIPGSKKKWDNDEEITEYKNSVTALIDYLREPLPVYIVLQTPNKYDRISIAVIKSLISLYREFSTELSTIQKTHNYLGFNDVIILAGKLLRENPAVRKRYSEKYKHIMIDEFQDTNYPRWDIIRLIASDENNRLRTSGLFIVGDKKQSVYRFNQADVEVVDTVKKEFDSVRDPGDDVFIDLNDNYRASGAYIDNVINPLFSEVFQTDEDHERKPYEAEFNPTHLAGKIKDRESISAKTNATCSLRVSLIEKEDRDKNDIGALNTALAVKELLEWGDECGLTGMDQPVIGVLLRKFTNIQSYLKIFQKYGIPFEIVSGRNLFHQQETYDLFHLISVLNNPNDDLALLGLLRSPVFCLPDKKIHRIRKGLKINGASLYSLITRDPELSRISDKINIWRDAARLRPLDRLIEDIISSDHREFGYYSEAGGKQKIANIDKLIGIIHSVSSKGSSLRDVCEYFRYNISNNPDTAQAGSKNNAPVQILTIHKSKGLEFPAVVIPELNTSGSGHGPVLPFGKINDHRTDEEHFECSISLTGDDDQKLGQGIINGLRYYEGLRDEAEDKRLFYVAITRAKYRAVLLADHRDGSPGKKKSWWWTKHIEHAFGLPELTNLSETEPVTPGLPASEIKILPKDDILKGLEKDSSDQKMPLEWTDPPSYDEPDEFFDYSVHDLMDHIFPESKPDGQGNGERSGTAIEVGEIFHIIMENEWWRSGNEAEIENYIKNSYHYLEYEPLIEKIRRHTENLQESEFLKSMKKSEEKYYELPVTGWFRIANKLFQISGKIDLIYRIGSKWYVVDYKTSGSQKDRRRHELQVQIYLMIIKQLYNIEAEGKIYYSDMNKLESVGEESELTVQKIMPDDKLVVRNKDRSNSICIEKILAGKYPGSTIIINPTKHNSLEVLKTLSAKRLIDSSIRITTLDNYIRSHNFSGTQNTTELRRLLTQKALDDNEAPRGKIDLLSKAFQKAESGDVELHRDIEPVYEKYIKIKTEKSILSDPDIINKIRADIHFGDKRVILNKLHKTSREYFDLFRTISDKADQFYFIDNFNDDKISTKLKYNPSIWETSSPVTDMSSGQLYSKCHTIADEVENCAVMIRNIPRWEERTGQLKIAVSSMEKYVPLIKKIFDWYGIPVTVAKNEPVLERPAAQLLLRFIDLLENSAYPDWNTVANIILHPLFDHEEEYFELDLWARTNGIRFFRDIPGAVKNSIPDEKKRKDITEVYQKIETELSKYALESAADLIRIRDMIFSFFADIDLKRQLNISRLSKGIYEKLNTVLENILRNHHTAGIPGGLKVFKQELLQSLEEAEIPTKEQDYGIEVLGFMDTLHIDPDRLYILGLTEDEFPVKPLFNPYVENSTDYNWRLGLNLYRHWKSLGDSVHFFTSTRNNDDEPLQPSTFTEFLKQSDHTERSNRDVLSPRDHYLLYSGRLIPEPADDKNFISRHNAYLAKSVNEFRGKTEKAENSEFIFSPTSLDILLSCPMRYWFKKVLNIEPSEFDETSKNQLNKGRALHTALDNFGKKAGFEILKSDLNKACSILDEELRQALALNDFNTEEDLITYYMLISYLRGLKDKNPDNVLIQLFEWNLDKFGNFDHAEFEKWIESPKAITGSHSILNDGDLLVKFKGKVDKLLIDNNTNTVTASDYKTGSVNMNDITGLWTSQFLVYYLVLKDNYPDHRVRLVYEQIKNFSNSGLKCFSGDLDAEENRNGVLFDDDFIKDSKKVIMDFCRKVLRGEFSITERFNRGRPCNICSYIGLCRKDS